MVSVMISLFLVVLFFCISFLFMKVFILFIKEGYHEISFCS